MNKNSLREKGFPQGGWENKAPNSIFFKLLELFQTSRARKLIFGLQVNRQGQQSQMTLPDRWYIGSPAKISNPHFSILYTFCENKFNVIYVLVQVQWISVDICG